MLGSQFRSNKKKKFVLLRSPTMPSDLVRRLEGKVAVVTGGASGIGESTARLFHRHGVKVIIADIQDQLGRAICEDLGPADCTFVHCDVTNESHVRDAVDAAIAGYGKLDIMFNNAGIVDPLKQSITENEKSDFERVLGVNTTGVFLGIKQAARVMVPARRGSIINTASVSSIFGGVATHAYTCSKHAVVGLTKSAAVELGQSGVRVNCISPYVVKTPLTKDFFKPRPEDGKTSPGIYSNLKGVELETEDIAEAVVYLGSDESRYVSGHNLVIDGGFTILNTSINVFH
ncbi:borneol dehydrogenase, mitochondrial-like [Aristolochia californica]|uniref:borneol dehydrogenase, mitochondrial-like n=1 Tax=Aristolochia californica TaxID=171875 RepID=UPI0035E21678